ncbi:MAG: HAMP domain-containing histidine kinase, partial [Planctomycetaceae bacterium]|nr:HAMP domain-containing histidine kinase [Planctomycetaceae bacterium]
ANYNSAKQTVVSGRSADMAKMEAGQMEVKPAEFNIALTVAAQADMAKPLVDRKNIELETAVEPNLPPVKQDESRIQQILNNLLSNAVKFTPEGGRIKVSVKKVNTYLLLTVSDTGVGISEEDQQIVFEKFRQGKNSATEGDMMKREHSGSGLGLSIVKEICKMLDGEITLESQLGAGSTFTVRLPWCLEPKRRTNSEMFNEIRQFAQNRVARRNTNNG